MEGFYIHLFTNTYINDMYLRTYPGVWNIVTNRDHITLRATGYTPESYSIHQYTIDGDIDIRNTSIEEYDSIGSIQFTPGRIMIRNHFDHKVVIYDEDNYVIGIDIIPIEEDSLETSLNQMSIVD